MKYAYIGLVFVLGVFAGRWSVTVPTLELSGPKKNSADGSDPKAAPKVPLTVLGTINAAEDVVKESLGEGAIVPQEPVANGNTIDERVDKATKCLESSKDDLRCLVDLGVALHYRGEFAKAKENFEKALSLPPTERAHGRGYTLLHYGMTLKSIGLSADAKKAFTEACERNTRSACDELSAK